MKKLLYVCLFPCCLLAKEDFSWGYSAPAEINIASEHHFFMSASFLYWKAQEEGLTYATITDDDGIILSQEMPCFKYKPGFKIEIGYLFAHDSWTTFAEYLRFYSRQMGGVAFEKDNNIIATWPLNSHDYYKSASSSWVINNNIAKIGLKRFYYLAEYLTISPIFAIKFLSIYQLFNVHYSDNIAMINDVTINNSSSSWGLGPLGGFNMNYFLVGNLRLFANADICLAYQHFNVTNVEKEAKRNNDVNGYFSPNCSFALGLGWGKYFANNKGHFDVFLSYEVNYFWYQNQMRALRDSFTTMMNGFAGSLYFYGLTLNARFDF